MNRDELAALREQLAEPGAIQVTSSQTGTTWAKDVSAPIKSKRTLGYFRANAASEWYEYILKKFLAYQSETKITKAQFAASIQKDAGQLNRLLAGPGNWTIETVSDLLLGMGERLKPLSEAIVIEAPKENTSPPETIASGGPAGPLRTGNAMTENPTSPPAETPESNAPKIIYLQDGGGMGEPLPEERYDEQVTWCGQSIEDDDTKYIRYDQYADLERRLKAAEVTAAKEAEWAGMQTTRMEKAEQQLAEAQKQVSEWWDYEAKGEAILRFKCEQELAEMTRQRDLAVAPEIADLRDALKKSETQNALAKAYVVERDFLLKHKADAAALREQLAEREGREAVAWMVTVPSQRPALFINEAAAKNAAEQWNSSVTPLVVRAERGGEVG